MNVSDAIAQMHRRSSTMHNAMCSLLNKDNAAPRSMHDWQVPPWTAESQ